MHNAEMAAAGHHVATEFMLEIDRQLNHLKSKTQECEANIAKTRQDQESHSINYYRHQQLSGNPENKGNKLRTC